MIKKFKEVREFESDEVPFQARDKKELLEHIEILNAVLNTNLIIVSSLDFEMILQIIISQVKDHIAADHGGIFLLNEKKDQLILRHAIPDLPADYTRVFYPHEGLVGYCIETGKAINIDDPTADSRFIREIDGLGAEKIANLLCVPLIVQEETLGAALVVNKKGGKSFSRDDATFFEAFARQAAIAIHNFYLIQNVIEKQKMEEELAYCIRLQKKILPEKAPSVAGYSFSAAIKPCEKIAGDWFNITRVENDIVDFMIADVSGKGITAAFIVAKAHAALQALLFSGLPVDQMITTLNVIIHDLLDVGQFITMFYGRLYLKEGYIQYINAGHNSPFLFLDQGHFVELEQTGKILGIDTNVYYKPHQVAFPKGSLLFLYTDGIIEAQNPQGELIGKQQIASIIDRHFDKPLKDIRNQILLRVKEHLNNKPASDDITMLFIKRHN